MDIANLFHNAGVEKSYYIPQIIFLFYYCIITVLSAICGNHKKYIAIVNIHFINNHVFFR